LRIKEQRPYPGLPGKWLLKRFVCACMYVCTFILHDWFVL